jgi:hypothetical protein
LSSRLGYRRCGSRADFFGADFFAADFLTGAAFFATFTAAFFTGVLSAAAFFVGDGNVFAACALTRAQRAFVAATIAALPALLSFRLGFAGPCAVGAGGSDCPINLAHLACCPRTILRLAASGNLALASGRFRRNGATWLGGTVQHGTEFDDLKVDPDLL